MQTARIISVAVLSDPKQAVDLLRSTCVNWSTVSDLLRLHCEGRVPNLEIQLRCRNTTGLAVWLHELGTEESKTLPERMTRMTLPFNGPEAERAAYRIVLLQYLAKLVRKLHSVDFATVEG